MKSPLPYKYSTIMFYVVNTVNALCLIKKKDACIIKKKAYK